MGHGTCAAPEVRSSIRDSGKAKGGSVGKPGTFVLSASPRELGGLKMAAWLTPSERIRFVFSPIPPKILILPELEIREITESEVIFFLICFFPLSPLSHGRNVAGPSLAQ